jgi:putative adenylate-forming enzyme
VFGVTVREIYMATEGLLGVACERGVLHLCEDAVKFEYEDPLPGSGLVAPVITDFTRSTQVMARYRMNDLVRLAEAPCPCGSPLQAVAAVEGRRDDILDLPALEGGSDVLVTPDILRNAIVDADRRIDDFRLVQTGPAELELTLLERVPDEAGEAARMAVDAALRLAGAAASVSLTRVAAFAVTERKNRRVERRRKPETVA